MYRALHYYPVAIHMVVPGVRELLLQPSPQDVRFGEGLQVHLAAAYGRISHCYHTYRTLQGGPVDPVLYQDTAGWTSGSSAITGHCRVDQWIQCYNRTLQGGPVDPVLYQDTTSGSSAISGHCRVDQWIQCYNRTLQGGPVDPVLSTGSTGPPCSVL